MTRSQKNILYFFDQSDWNSRMPVVLKAAEEDYKTGIVLIGSAMQTVDIPKKIQNYFIKTTQGRMNILAFLHLIFKIFKLLQKQKPDLVHTITLKYAFMSGLAALPFPHIKKIYTIAGLGYLFRSESSKAFVLRILIAPLLKLTLKSPNTFLIFQNPDDMALMIEHGFSDKNRATLVRGSGVDLEKFKPVKTEKKEIPIVLMPTRLVREKGIDIFVQAVKNIGPTKARFQIAGGLTKHNPSALTEEEMLNFTKNGTIEWLGHVSDMPALLASADIIVYPSYYGEGIPRVLLEAAAAGKPIITTDNPGCRETVRNGENGFLVAVKNPQALAGAIKTLLMDKKMREDMGQKSREIAETEFDVRLIVKQTIAVYSNRNEH